MKDELYRAIQRGDLESLRELLDVVGISEKVEFDGEQRELARYVLFGAAQTACGELDERVAQELIGRMAQEIDIFNFARSIVLHGKIEESRTLVPKGIRVYLASVDFASLAPRHIDPRPIEASTEKVIRSIGELDATSVMALLVYLEDVLGMNPALSAPIIRRIYELNLVHASVLFSEMANTILSGRS